MVQASHAAYESGLKNNNKYAETSSIIIFQIPDEITLNQELQRIQLLGIDCTSFYEPYDDTGVTAFATFPVVESQRHLFKSYTLWGRDFKKENFDLHHYLKEEKKRDKLVKESKVQTKQLIQQTKTLQMEFK